LRYEVAVASLFVVRGDFRLTKLLRDPLFALGKGRGRRNEKESEGKGNAGKEKADREGMETVR